MKVQDFLFLLVFGAVWIFRKRYLAAAGLVCLILAIPLFSFRIFFTAERLTWYAAAFFVSAAAVMLRTGRGRGH
ncbi:hypothetical protein A2Z33_05610 [Candidatus Gottesmanbacteria bacterium RBG_16_52_11]|uniref:Uncharacterized protein n=1 Tax=Candidatus Gottesmanbacteria bacterium RBG_16_52_11 TaxID=1798374 RepID=A0A1F5YNA6_9BACT|nr:MAG: hypothetical protein A2Z33_05610 [Candidatus Gottesmanbacteria bacterium RBG_16_52_11]